MSEVAFHFNAPDKVQYACRLLRKAYLKGSRLLVLVDPSEWDRLDASLWTLTPDAFIPHCFESDPEGVKARSPILIASALPQATGAEVLVNLQSGWVAEWSRFPRVIEVVSEEQNDRRSARDRWRRYCSEGVEPVHHDLLQSSG